MSKNKTFPQSKESEMMVLGCMLTDENALHIAASTLSEKDFYLPQHQTIFNALQESYHKNRPADIHIIAESLKDGDTLFDAGGVGYLMTLAQYAGTSANIEEYTKMVKDKSVLREMVAAGNAAIKCAMDNPEDAAKALAYSQQTFLKINPSYSTSSPGASIGSLLSGTQGDRTTPFMDLLHARQQRFMEHGLDSAITGVPTHFHALDKMINGMGQSNLIILAARPAMGKTALALNIAENVCFKSGKPVGFFSLEMNAEQLITRMICSQSGVSSSKVQTGNLTPNDLCALDECATKLQGQPFIVDDQPGMTITDLRTRARKMHAEHHIQFLVIDYLQLITSASTSRNTENRQQEISEISRLLKQLARELNIPILCLSQLSRKVEERASHRPLLSDLRESGAIEQDADVVCFLLRKEYYVASDNPGGAELIVAKNRHGGIGDIPLTFRKEISQFVNHNGMKQ